MLTISAQVLVGLLLGIVGIILASPLTAVVLILVCLLYVENTLGGTVADDSSKTGGDASR